MSLLHVLFYVKAAGGLNMLLDTEGGAQQDRIDGGSQLFALRIAESLGEWVRPARRCARSTIATAAFGRSRRRRGRGPPRHRGDPAAAGGAHRLRADACRPRAISSPQRMPEGRLAKCMAVYEEPSGETTV